MLDKGQRQKEARNKPPGLQNEGLSDFMLCPQQNLPVLTGLLHVRECSVWEDTTERPETETSIFLSQVAYYLLP